MPAVGALDLRIRGVVQGVGFRPFVYRLARRHALAGWVRNGESGVAVHVEGPLDALDAFARAVVDEAPPAASIASVDATPGAFERHREFAIRESSAGERPTARIAPDIAVCRACLRELFDPADRRYRYPYINCTDCGPRYSIVLGLPYDRPATTMASWTMCARCEAEYDDPADRRFHAQPQACPACGPSYVLREDGRDEMRGTAAIAAAAARLRDGAIVAIKGIGGYHLACNATDAEAVAALRERKYRKERPFAVMTCSVELARTLVELDDAAEALLTSVARPIVLARARRVLEGVAPGNRELGVMLPYTPLHHLLFAEGAPDVLVLTSANRSSEPIAFEDADAVANLAGIAEAFLVGERRIARRIDDSVARVTAAGSSVLRRARGFAPRAIVTIPATRSILAVGGDLKNAIALVVAGQAFVSQHVGDLDHLPARDAFEQTVHDLCAMYEIHEDELLLAHDAHPEYASSVFARSTLGEHVAIQHHRAHVASVLAERGEWDREVIGVAFDGTGYGDDGTIWGGEIFTGSIRGGFDRVAHLREAPLPGGDAAAQFPVQAAAGFLFDLDDLPDLTAEPFGFPARYAFARSMIERGVRTFRTTSMGRLFDTVAALLGFTREITFEGQAAMWLEHQAAAASETAAYEFPLRDGELDYRPLLAAIVDDRLCGRDGGSIARAFHGAVVEAVVGVHAAFGADRPLVASGGVWQNRLLVESLYARLGESLWLNRIVPANDGGLCLGQAALAAVAMRS
ncbi:MAG: (NiFe) hydrogenase maturation protein HypF [Candidatus Eremiobacteraeota bacterium]|nr:(NiFe) hydrogenase maturation protein HypF [Candidatus Eremiobacteraeota bacterium]